MEILNGITDALFVEFMADETGNDDNLLKTWATGQAMMRIKTELSILKSRGEMDAYNNELDKQNGR